MGTHHQEDRSDKRHPEVREPGHRVIEADLGQDIWPLTRDREREEDNHPGGHHRHDHQITQSRPPFLPPDDQRHEQPDHIQETECVAEPEQGCHPLWARTRQVNQGLLPRRDAVYPEHHPDDQKQPEYRGEDIARPPDARLAIR